MLILGLLILIFLSILGLSILKCLSSSRVIVLTDKFIFMTGEAITIHIKAINPTNSTIELHFSTSHQFDYIIRDISGREVYYWSAGKGFLQVLTKITIPPRSYYLINVTHEPSELLLFPGVYSIEGIVLGYGSGITRIVVISPFLLISGTSVVVTVVIIGSALIWWRKKKRKQKNKNFGFKNKSRFFYIKIPFNPQGKASVIFTLTNWPTKSF